MKKIVMSLLAFSLIFSLTGCSTTTSKTTSNTQETTVSETSNSDVQSTGDTLTKDETVYVMCDSTGDVNKIIVSDWIQNGTESDTITDKTNLNDIEVTKGDATYTLDESQMTIWDSKGGDVYYQGTTNKTLPVTMKVSYQLDGKAISAKDLEGKSGKVTIRYDYTNNSYQTKKIDGKETKIYVPFLMLTGMLLDNDVFTNIEVSNGKIVNISGQSAVMGFALPGMQESLDISSNDVEIPNYVEVKADVKDFKLGTTMTIAQNEIFNDLDTSNIDDVDDLKDSMKKLTDGMDQLIDGSNELYENLGLLLTKSNELVTGINKIAEGSTKLKNAGSDLYDGSVSLRDGLKSLNSGLKTLVSNNDTLNGGAKQVFETLLSTAKTQLEASELSSLGIKIPTLTISNYDKKLESLINELNSTDGTAYKAAYNKALQEVTNQVNANEATIKTKVEEAVKSQVEEKVTATVKTQVESKVTEAVKATVEAGVKAKADDIYKQAVLSTVQEQVVTGIMKQNSCSQEEALKYLETDEGKTLLATTVSQAVGALTDEEKEKALNTVIEQQMASDDIKATISKNVEEQMASDDIKATISKNVEEQMNTDTIKATINENVKTQKQNLIDQNMASDTVTKQITESLSDGAKSIVELKASLDQYKVFYNGLKDYTAGVESAYEGSQQLYSGSKTLAEGMKEASEGLDTLDAGIQELKTKSSALPDGVSKLKDGSMQLSEGIKKLNDEGISKIVDLVDGDLGDIIDRLDAIKEVSKDYNNFAGISDSMDGTVKFIYKTDEIGE
jgi:putative membrane protein